MSLEDNEFRALWDQFMATCTVARTDEKGEPVVLVTDQLAYDGIAYILRQLNDIARLGDVNVVQSRTLLVKALQDWFVLVYINHYDNAKRPIEKDPFYTSGYTLICLLFSRVEAGRDRKLLIEELKAKQPTTNMIMSGGR